MTKAQIKELYPTVYQVFFTVTAPPVDEPPKTAWETFRAKKLEIEKRNGS